MSRFRDQTRAMIAGAKQQVTATATQFVEEVVTDLVDSTPGPGLQYEQTEYIASGRLRGGYQAGESAPARASRFTGGPYEDRGDETVARLMVSFKPLPAKISIWNEVAYAYWVYHGLQNLAHIGPRPWIDDVALRAPQHFAVAKSKVSRSL